MRLPWPGELGGPGWEGRARIVAQGRIALFDDSNAFEGAVAVFERLLAAMLGDDEGVGSERSSRSAAQQAQSGGVFGGSVVRGIEKNKAEVLEWRCGRAAKECACAGSVDAGLSGDAEAGEVGAENFESSRGALDKGDLRSAAAERLDADSTGARVEVEKDGAFYAGSKNVEEGLAQAVAGGAGGQARGRSEGARTETSGDDAHRETG